MTVTLVAEDGSGKSNANAYASAGAADAYHTKHLYATTWTAASSATKDTALTMATRLIDVEFTFMGVKVSDTQALEWPRFDIYDRDGFIVQATTIPPALIDATAEFARLLIAEDRTAETGDRGFSRIKAGSVEADINPRDRKRVVPPTVAAMLAPFGRLRNAATRLIRA